MFLLHTASTAVPFCPFCAKKTWRNSCAPRLQIQCSLTTLPPDGTWGSRARAGRQGSFFRYHQLFMAVGSWWTFCLWNMNTSRIKNLEAHLGRSRQEFMLIRSRVRSLRNMISCLELQPITSSINVCNNSKICHDCFAHGYCSQQLKSENPSPKSFEAVTVVCYRQLKTEKVTRSHINILHREDLQIFP